MDIVAHYTKTRNNHEYKDGTFYIDVGGVGFNIVSNLVYNHFKTYLFTVLRSDGAHADNESPSAIIIKRTLEERQIPMDYVFNVPSYSESGFVAHMYSKNDSSIRKLESGITANLIEDIPFDPQKLRDAIRHSLIVAIDCNLGSNQISEIIRLTKEYNKPLFVCSVSESRVSQAIDRNFGRTDCYKLFCLNGSEAKPFCDGWENIESKAEIIALCKKFKTEQLVITSGERGFSVFFADGFKETFRPFYISDKVSELGAGDALFAGILAHYCENNLSFDWQECYLKIKTFVTQVLRSKYATVPFVTNKNQIGATPLVRVESVNHRAIQSRPYIFEEENLARIKKENVRIIMGQLDVDLIEFDNYNPGRVDYTNYHKSEKEQLEKILFFGKKNKVDLIVFPELSISKASIGVLENYANENDCIIVAGSQYYDEGLEIVDCSNYQSGGGLINASRVIIPNDSRLFLTHKIYPSKPETSSIFNESIRNGSVIKKFTNTTIGNFVVVVCYDFIEDNNIINEDLKHNHKDLDFVIIIAKQRRTLQYSKKIDPYVEDLQRNGENGIYVIYCNALSKKNQSDGCSSFFGYLDDHWKGILYEKKITDANPETKLIDCENRRLACCFEVSIKNKILPRLTKHEHSTIKYLGDVLYETSGLLQTDNDVGLLSLGKKHGATAYDTIEELVNAFKAAYEVDPSCYEHFLMLIMDLVIASKFQNKGIFRLMLGIPKADGSFAIPSSVCHNVDYERLIRIRARANWKTKRTFLAFGVRHSTERTFCYIRKSHEEPDYYQDFHPPENTVMPTEKHLIIPIKKNTYKSLDSDSKSIDQNVEVGTEVESGSDSTCAGVLTISTTEDTLLSDEFLDEYQNELAIYIDAFRDVLTCINQTALN